MVKYDADAARDIERSYNNTEITNQRVKTVEAMALRAGECVLDVGCGTGLLTELIATGVGESGRVVGVDYSQDMLDFAACRCDPLHNVELHQGNVTQLEFEDETFDAASCVQTLLYVDEVDKAINELYRVIKPRGRVAILETDWRGVVMNSDDPELTRTIFEAWDETVASPNLPPRLIPMLKQSGFSSIRTQAIPLLNDSYNENSFSGSMIEYITRNAVKRGKLEQQQADRWIQNIIALQAKQAYFFCVNRFLFTAVK